jgi:hypothetical protein
MDRRIRHVVFQLLRVRIPEYNIRGILKSFNFTSFPLYIPLYEYGSAEHAFL